MRNAGLEEAQAGIKIARRNINNLRYAHDTTLMAEREEELKSLLMKVKVKSEKAQHSENEDYGIWSHHFMANGWKTVANFIFLGCKITANGDCSHETKRRLLLGRKVMTNLDSILKSRNITLPTKVHLVKTLESPLDCKEIQPVHPKGDQSWVFVGRTDVEAETPILWPPDVKS